MCKLIRFLVVLSFVISSEGLYAKHLNYYGFNAAFNFHQNTIYDIKQGQNHIIWLATSNGLVKFDGVNFQVFSHNDFDNAYFNLQFDAQGRVWCANFYGQLFVLDNDSLQLAFNLSRKGDFINNYNLTHFPDVYLYFENINEVVQVNFLAPEKEKSIIVEGQKLFSLNTKNDKLLFSVTQKNEQHYFLNKVNIDFKDLTKTTIPQLILPFINGKNGIFWCDNGLYYYQFSNRGLIAKVNQGKLDTVFVFKDIDNYSLNKIVVQNDRTWLLTRNGAFELDLKNKIIINAVLENKNTSSVFNDYEGNLWIGTLNEGVFIVPKNNTQVLNITSSGIAYSAMSSQKRIYFVSNNSELLYTDKPYNKVYKASNEAIEVAPIFFDQNEEKLLLGSHQKYFDFKRKNLVQPDQNKQFLLFKNTLHLGRNVYVNTSYSYAYLSGSIQDSLTTQFNFGNIGPDNHIIRKFRCNKLAINAHKTALYIDYVDGLFCYTIQNNPQQLTFQNKAIQISDIASDGFDDNIVWCATKSGWLLKLNQDQILDSLKIPEAVHHITLTPSYLFFSGANSIYKYNKVEKVTEVFYENSNFTNNNVSNLFFKDDTLIAVNQNSLYFIPAKGKLQNNTYPEVYFTEVKLNGTLLNFENPIQFKTQNSNLDISFRALSVANKSGVVFKYKLNNQPWLEVNHLNPNVKLFNLDEGYYTFSVIACGRPNQCSKIKTLQFTVIPPFYKTWWFIAIFLLCLIAVTVIAVASYLKFKANKIRVKTNYQKLQKEIYKAKIATLRSQMNPHFIFNALNTIQEFILTNQKEIASDYLADFADLIRMYLHQSNQNQISLFYEIEALKLYLRLENMRFSGELNYTIDVGKDVNTDAIKVPVMLIQPFVENSIKHGLMPLRGQKILEIKVQSSGKNNVLISITDNGVGRQASEKMKENNKVFHQSFATNANKNLVELINQFNQHPIQVNIIDLKEPNQTAKGTKVEILIPVP